MAKTKVQQQQATGQRAAIYARVSDKSQDGDDKNSISEQTWARWKPTARARG